MMRTPLPVLTQGRRAHCGSFHSWVCVSMHTQNDIRRLFSRVPFMSVLSSKSVFPSDHLSNVTNLLMNLLSKHTPGAPFFRKRKCWKQVVTRLELIIPVEVVWPHG